MNTLSRILRCGSVLLLTLFGASGAFAENTAPVGESIASEKWQEFHSVNGKCKLKFPGHPQHVSENMRFADGEYSLRYDAYVSAMSKETVFMLLVAQYPDFVDESYARMSLEGFLNGILNHNPNNQLLFADLVLVNGQEALDFFIRTGNVYFKGRAIMVKNSLYLMAMETEITAYNEEHFDTFVNSFTFAK